MSGATIQRKAHFQKLLKEERHKTKRVIPQRQSGHVPHSAVISATLENELKLGMQIGFSSGTEEGFLSSQSGLEDLRNLVLGSSFTQISSEETESELNSLNELLKPLEVSLPDKQIITPSSDPISPNDSIKPIKKKKKSDKIEKESKRSKKKKEGQEKMEKKEGKEKMERKEEKEKREEKEKIEKKEGKEKIKVQKKASDPEKSSITKETPKKSKEKSFHQIDFSKLSSEECYLLQLEMLVKKSNQQNAW